MPQPEAADVSFPSLTAPGSHSKTFIPQVFLVPERGVTGWRETSVALTVQREESGGSLKGSAWTPGRLLALPEKGLPPSQL